MKFEEYKKLVAGLNTSPMDAFVRENNIAIIEWIHDDLSGLEVTFVICPPVLEVHHQCSLCSLDSALDS